MTWSMVILLLVGAAIVLLVAELVLPTHGMLGIVALLCFGGAIGTCFYVNRWLGVGVLCGSVILSPLLLSGALALWKRSYLGRRLILPERPAIDPVNTPPTILSGTVGVAVSELKPMGEVEFNQQRVEAVSELGFIEPGSRVTLLRFENGVARVRRA